MAAVMQPPRPSMDRSSSFDQTRRVNPAAFPASTSRPSLSQTPSHTSSHHRHSFTQAQTTHSRSSSSASNQRPASIISASSPYQQPSPSHSHHASYFPNQHQQPVYGSLGPQQAWATAALPATAFYASPFHAYGPAPGAGGNQVFHHGFQQSQADFAAWAGAYHNMMQHGQFAPPAAEYLQHEDRPRSVSSPQPASPYDRPISPPHLAPPPTAAQTTSASSKPPVQAFHPYKRQPGHRPSRENMASASVMPRSVSQPIMPTAQSRPAPVTTQPQQQHQRAPSLDTPPPIKRNERSSGSFERERPAASKTATSPAPAARTVTPLHTGPIANATNMPTPASRPSPLSNAVSPAPEPEKKSLKGRFKKALGGDSKRSTPPASVASTPAKSPAPVSTATTRSSTPLATPQHEALNPPSAPFAVSNQSAMNSDVSLAETARTTTTLAGEGKEKKKGLFRMKNMSTDNISLSSTVSSASMMIRRMGSIGKLARRNSLAGISKIFKDKPKDEDAALPEVDGNDKKERKKEKRRRQKDKKKAEAAQPTVSHATAESGRISNEDDDRALAGLSPAAKLARQHTLKSKAEQAKRDREQRQRGSDKSQTGEPTWDNNTQTRTGPPVLPSIESMSSGISSFADASSPSGGGPEVLRVQPKSRQTVVHAVNVADHEYDSEDDSSDGETIEDVTIGIAQTRLSSETNGTAREADEDFKRTWGNAWIDKNAVPKKGILKQAYSFSEGQTSRHRSSSTADAAQAHIGPLSHIPPSDPAQIDGLAHPHPQKGVDFAEHLDDVAGDYRSPGGVYQQPAHNSSAPALSLQPDGRPRPPPAGRSMTVPNARRLEWAPECAVYATYDAGTYDRRSEPATCNRLTPELAQAIKAELNAFKMEMPVHPQSRGYTHYFA